MATSITRLIIGAVALLASAGGVLAAPAEDRLLPFDQYTTAKARTLATTYASALRELNAAIYHCLPWVEVHRASIGFFRPKHITEDQRYLSVRIYIDQDPSPAFAKMTVEERAAAMFSRYAGPLLRRMAKDRTLLTDAGLDGFTTILEWVKQGDKGPGGNPIHETIAAFVQRAVAQEYLAGRIKADELARRARVMGWDGEKALGQLKFSAWDDDFVSTFKVKNYELQPGVTCDAPAS